MTQLAQDTFIRADQSGFGTASDGSTYSHPIGTATLAIVSNEGKITLGSSDDYVLIGSGTSAPVNVLVRTATDSNGDNIGVTGRYASGPSLYRALLNNQTFFLQKDVSGTITTLASTAFSYGANQFCWIRLICQGTAISASVWLDGNSEPGTATLSATDSSITSAGQYGIVSLNSSGSNYFDHLTVTNNQNAINLVTQAQAKFSVRANLQTQTRSKFLVRLALKTQTEARFLVRLALRTHGEARFTVRSIQQTQARAKFLTRAKLGTTARSKFITRLALSSEAWVQFLVNQVVAPPTHFISATWVTRDMQATWKTRDMQATWKTKG